MIGMIAAASWTAATHLVLLAIGIFLTIVGCTLAIRSIRPNSEQAGSVLHKDKDGEANEQTQRRYQATAKLLLIASTLISIAGLATAIAYGIFELSETNQRNRSLVSGLLAAWSPLLLWVGDSKL